jgi:hypothetical protein
MINDNQKVAMVCVGLGVVFLLLGMILLFDSGLLAIGNILFLVGLTMLFGIQSCLSFFNPMRKPRGVICFALGVILVLMRWSVIGMLVEIIGMVEMFGTFLPMVVSVLRGVPLIGPFLRLPLVSVVIDKLAGVKTKRPPV